MVKNKKIKLTNTEIDSFAAFAIWVNLNQIKQFELILLKGHLYVEAILNTVLDRKNVVKIGDLSFFKKMKEFEKLGFQNHTNWKIIIASLYHINQIRNKLAHDFDYKTALEDLTKWSSRINENLIGEKHSKFTVRTKIVHAFSTLSENLLALTFESEGKIEKHKKDN